MSVPCHDEPLYTIDGLAADFGISPRTVEHYIACDIMPKALGYHPNGFNYGHSHYQALAKYRAQITARRPQTRRRRHHAHTVKVHSRELVA